MNFEIVQNIAIYPLAFEIMDETSVSRDCDLNQGLAVRS